MEVGIGQSAD